MTEHLAKPERRIHVTADSSPCGVAALEIAVKFAAAIEAELEGLFLEDEGLVLAAAFPFVREVSEITASCRPVDVPALEQAWRGAAERVGAALEELAKKEGLAWQYTVRRGRFGGWLRETLESGAIAIVGRRTLRPTSMSRMGRTVSASPQRVMVVADDGPSLAAVVEVASLLMAESAGEITILRSLGTDDDRLDIRTLLPESVSETLPPSMVVRAIHLTQVADMPRVVAAAPTRLLVIAADHSFVRERGVQWLLGALDCPIAILP